MTNVLLIDADPVHAEHIKRALSLRGLVTAHTVSSGEAVRRLKRWAVPIHLVVLTIADRSRPWLEILHQLQQAAWQTGIGDFPIFLCISRLNCGAEFQLRVERMGARFVIE